MVDPDGSTPFTAHTLDPVPLIVVADGLSGLASGGKLADVAPTLLGLIGVDIPSQWTGRSLLLY
jgi:2,3-bisphosphoglycerate-independent phosphoglycerate mutase